MKCGDFYECNGLHESVQGGEGLSLGLSLFCGGISCRSGTPLMGGLGEWARRDPAGHRPAHRCHLLYDPLPQGERTLSPRHVAGC